MKARYLKISDKDLKSRIKKLFEISKSCKICPRNCEINRVDGEKGFCKLGMNPVIFSASPHFGEESVLVGNYGSGTIFFTSCNLKCVYCQNYEISQLGRGTEITFEELADSMLELQRMKCHNINLVTPISQIYGILKALFIARKKGLSLPLVYNTNCYDSVNVLKLLKDIIDIYMPDVKYSEEKFANDYSSARNYPEIMKNALKEMHMQVGDLVLDKNGIAKKGLLVRHLVLPNNLAGTKKIFEFISKEISKNTFINIMDQFYPCYNAFKYPKLSRRITQKEYSRAINFAKGVNLKRFYSQ